MGHHPGYAQPAAPAPAPTPAPYGEEFFIFYQMYLYMYSLDGLTNLKSTNPEFVFTKLNVVIHIYSTLNISSHKTS